MPAACVAFGSARGLEIVAPRKIQHSPWQGALEHSGGDILCLQQLQIHSMRNRSSHQFSSLAAILRSFHLSALGWPSVWCPTARRDALVQKTCVRRRQGVVCLGWPWIVVFPLFFEKPKMIGILGIGVWRILGAFFTKSEVWIHLIFHHPPTCCWVILHRSISIWYVWLQQRGMNRWFIACWWCEFVLSVFSGASWGSGQLWKRCGLVRENNQVVVFRKKPSRKTIQLAAFAFDKKPGKVSR